MRGIRKIATWLGWGIGFLSSVGGGLGAASVIAMTGLVTVEIIGRTLFKFSTLISDEMSGYLLVAMGFLGLGYTLKIEGHIRVDTVIMRLSPRLRSLLIATWCLAGLVYVSVLTSVFWRLVLESYTMKTTSIGLGRTPLFIPQMAMPIGVMLLGLQLLVELSRNIRTLAGPGGRDATGPGGLPASVERQEQ